MVGKNAPKIGFSPDFLFLSYFFPIFSPGPISGPIWFPILGRRSETYFLAGRLDRKSEGPFHNAPVTKFDIGSLRKNPRRCL